MFSAKDKKEIIEAYYNITNEHRVLEDCPRSMLRKAALGMYINPDVVKKKKDKELYSDIMSCYDEGRFPIVKDDSLTAWINLASEQYGLEIRDIIELEEGDKLDLLLFDRNIGDYMDGTKRKKGYKPTKKGLSYGIYTHKKGLMGKMYFPDLDITHDPFIWQINTKALSKPNDPKPLPFWSPISEYNPCRDKCCVLTKNKNHPMESELVEMYPPIVDKENNMLTIGDAKYNLEIKVGWRGPCMKREDAKNLPEYVYHYDNWWDDYIPYRYSNFLNIKREHAKYLEEQRQKKIAQTVRKIS